MGTGDITPGARGEGRLSRLDSGPNGIVEGDVEGLQKSWVQGLAPFGGRASDCLINVLEAGIEIKRVLGWRGGFQAGFHAICS
jgi:hypothetical protein